MKQGVRTWTLLDNSEVLLKSFESVVRQSFINLVDIISRHQGSTERQVSGPRGPRRSAGLKIFLGPLPVRSADRYFSLAGPVRFLFRTTLILDD